MSSAIRLVAYQTADPQTVRFCLVFAAPVDDEPPAVADAWLETGEGPAQDVGPILAPGPFTWRTGREVELAVQTYPGEGPYTARLLWGETLVQATVKPGLAQPAAAAGPQAQLVSFAVESITGRPLERSARWTVRGLGKREILRLDGGAGQAQLYVQDDPADERTGSAWLAFAKPGSYLVAIDVLDEERFWLAALVEYPLEVSALPDEEAGLSLPVESAPLPPFAPVADRLLDADIGGQGPWQATVYARPAWGWLRTYASPGGSAVLRVLPQGSYLSLRGETAIGSALWYQAAGQDWVAADVIEPVLPSTLRGVTFTAQAPEVDQGGRPALVMARVLNVRLHPGVQAGNAPCEQLAAGAQVTVYEHMRYGGALWYRIAPDRWVHGDHLRLLPAPQFVQPPRAPLALPLGWVVAPALNLRARPGIAAENGPVGQIEHNQVVPIYDSINLGGTTWHCIGDDRWIEGAWVAVARAARRPAAIAGSAHWVAIALAEQTLVAYEGDRPVYAAMVATGRKATTTPPGLFSVQRRSERVLLAGGSAGRGSAFYLEDVPWIQYFHGGYALHGAYWHDSFGRPRSHGCVNLSLYDAWWLYRWQVEKVLIR